MPPPLRAGFGGRVFGCDVCQEVCPWNHRPLPEGDARFSPRPLSALAPAEVAALAPEEFERLAAGMAVARVRYDGLRRNALYAIGTARDGGAREVVKRLVDDPDASVATPRPGPWPPRQRLGEESGRDGRALVVRRRVRYDRHGSMAGKPKDGDRERDRDVGTLTRPSGIARDRHKEEARAAAAVRGAAAQRRLHHARNSSCTS